MKKALLGAGAIVALAIVGLVWLSSEKAESAVVTTDIAINGMSCQNCVDKVKATLQELNGVKAVEVRLENGLATVKYDPALVTVPAMEAGIANLGYEAGKAGASSTPEKAHDCEGEAAAGCCSSKSPGPKT
ncbi:MAG: heavy-metal-associated domain-containing protein [bacterium]